MRKGCFGACVVGELTGFADEFDVGCERPS